ncbi:MAG: 50S ribosomal protein L9, partial [Cytophagales bacterium]|nr:50S ribosomal protein L9 [Cytophagales bacterium]
MEVILKEDVKGVGYKNDIIDVKPGFGRNFLIPRKLAELATPGTKKSREELLKQVQHKQEKIKKDALEIASKIGDSVLEIRAKAGETGKIFGSITAIQ